MRTFFPTLDSVLAAGNTSTRSIRIPTANLTAYHVGLAGTSDSSTTVLSMSETGSTTPNGLNCTIDYSGALGAMRAMQFAAAHNGSSASQSPIGGSFTASLGIKNTGTAQVTALQGTASLKDTVTHASNATNLQNIFECTDEGAVITGGTINARSVWAKEPAAYTGAATIRRWSILCSGDFQINNNKKLIIGGADTGVGDDYLLGTGSLIETYISSVKVCDFSSTALTLVDGIDIKAGTTTGSSFGATASELVGFHGAKVAQESAFTQTYSTSTKTVPVISSAAFAWVSTNAAPWGYSSQAQADAIGTNLNAINADCRINRQLINAVIDILRNKGITA